MDRLTQPRLPITYTVNRDVAQIVIGKLLGMPDGPTFMVVRIPEEDKCHIHMSKRTYAWLKVRLAEDRQNGGLR